MATVEGPEDADYLQYLPLYKAIDTGDWETAEEFLSDKPEALTARLSEYETRPLHVAVQAGNVDIVAELVNRLDKIELELKTHDGSTALTYAAGGGIIAIAELLIKKNPKLITIPDNYGRMPVVLASMSDHKAMAKYLYTKTPKDELSPERGESGAALLTSCILGDMFDVALDLLQHHRRLAVTQDADSDTAPEMLAQKPYAFPSGSKLRCWEHWIYSLICTRSPECLRNTNGDIERHYNGSTNKRNMIAEGLYKLVETLCWHLKDFVPSIKPIYDLKLSHVQAKELLCCICEVISTCHWKDLDKIGVSKAVFNAVKNGIVQFIEEIIKQYPDILWIKNENGLGIFHYAAMCREEKIFSLIYRMDTKRDLLTRGYDKDGNNILHHAALLAPSDQLDRVTGAALQMQKELQWFKEMEDFVQPKYRHMTNKANKTPRALFTEQHRELKKEGEKWLKSTANSSSIVAVLIATVMFSGVFTIPGGNDDQTGDPHYLHRDSFLLFLGYDGLSIFASSISLLIFLGIHSARYREEDFLVSLPRRLILGLSYLLISIMSMMVSFGITLIMMLGQQLPWFPLPIILYGSLVLIFFAMHQFPLLVEIVWSTYVAGIFDKPKKKWSFMSRKMRRN